MDDRTTHLTDAQLGELADGSLADAERERAVQHAEACARCRTALHETRALLVLAREARGGTPAPPELWPLVAASTMHAARVRRQVLRSMRGVLLVGALALVAATAAVTIFVVRQLQPPTQPPQPTQPSQPPAPRQPPPPSAPPAPSAPRAPAPAGR